VSLEGASACHVSCRHCRANSAPKPSHDQIKKVTVEPMSYVDRVFSHVSGETLIKIEDVHATLASGFRRLGKGRRGG
jgi:MoaA/NifB/PqqE/SkfB family radical SAM enzyme